MTTQFPDLKEQSVFITGGGSGIGAYLTQGFLKQGANVAFIGRSNADAFVDKMHQETGRKPLFIQGDITKADDLRTAIETAARVNGPIAKLVNNAGNDQRHSTLDVTEAYWDQMQAVNLKAYFFASQTVLGGMIKNNVTDGAIVNFSSASYMMGNTGYPVYTTANAGITGLSRSLAREFGPHGIRVNTLVPGWVLTEKQKELWATPQDLAYHLKKQCLKVHLIPEDIVGPTLFLASNTSKAMTGQAMVVDGGVVVTG